MKKFSNYIKFCNALLLINFFTHCNSATDKDFKNTSSTISNRPIEHIYKKYPMGDLNNDKIQDTAIIIYNIRYNPEECVDPECKVKIEFTGNIPSFTVDMSMGVYAVKTDDLNNDGANEILLFSRTWEGMWQRMYVNSYKDKTWRTLADGKAFGFEDEDFENRIMRIDSNKFALIVDEYNDQTTEYERKEKIIVTK